MAYAQKNYNAMMGGDNRGKGAVYSIRKIGCFLTSFANLMEGFGRPVDPVALNAVFRDRKIYLDIDDGVFDDLGWQSITAFDGNVVVKRIGSGTPPNANCIVKLKDTTNQFGTHFCKVYSVDGDTVMIVDSWDGKIKSAKAYGPIMQWAEYGNNTPQAVQPAVVAPIPAATGDKLDLPASASSWRVYRTSLAWTPGAMVGKEVGTLNPAKYNGLTYDVLGRPHDNVVTINTDYYGVVNIYVGPETGAKIYSLAPVETPPAAPVEAPVATQPDAVKVTVKKDTTDFRKSFNAESAGTYIATQSCRVEDVSGELSALVLPQEQRVQVGGDFMYKGAKYYRTKKAVANDWWYAIPEGALKLMKLDQLPHYVEDKDDELLLNMNLIDEAKEFVSSKSVRQRLVAVIATISGLAKRLIGNKK